MINQTNKIRKQTLLEILILSAKKELYISFKPEIQGGLVIEIYNPIRNFKSEFSLMPENLNEENLVECIEQTIKNL